MSFDTRTAKPDFILETYIKASPTKVWDALTKPEHIQRYHFAHALPSAVKKAGARVDYMLPNGNNMLTFEVVDEEPGKRLDMTFEPNFIDGAEVPVTRCVYEVEEQGDVCKLTVMHFQLVPALEGVRSGWSSIVSGLKTYVETGEILFPGDA